MSHLYEVKYEGKVAVVNNANSAKLVDDIISGLYIIIVFVHIGYF